MSKIFVDGSKLIHHLDEVSNWKSNSLDCPIHVEISPASGCNQRCNLCCVDYLGHKTKMLSKKTLVNLPIQMKEAGVKSVLLAGEGEPLVNPHITEMVQVAHEVELDIALNSNGILFDKKVVDETLDKYIWTRFSLQASNEKLYNSIHNGQIGDFKKFVENMSYATNLKSKNSLDTTIGIQQILINENYRDVLNSAKLAKELGADYFIIKRFSKHPLNTYNVPEDLYKESMDLFEEMEKLTDKNFKSIVRWNNFTQDCNRSYKKCIGLPFIAQILADGEIYPCAQFYHKNEFSYGNIEKNSFAEIVSGLKAKEIQKRIKDNQDVSKCMSYCRHHSTNQFLWSIYDEPDHVNFI